MNRSIRLFSFSVVCLVMLVSCATAPPICRGPANASDSSCFDFLKRPPKTSLKLVSHSDPILQKSAKELSGHEISSEEVQVFIVDLKNLLRRRFATSGIAAPQVGNSIRVAIVDLKGQGLVTLINPVVTVLGTTTTTNLEACLFLPRMFRVKRPAHIRIDYLDENGEKKSQSLNGRDAVLVQHKIDHLNGVLTSDRVYNKMLEKIEYLSDDSLIQVNRVLSIVANKKLKKQFLVEIKDVDNPYGLASSLKSDGGLGSDEMVAQEIIELYRILYVKNLNQKKKFTELNHWVKSESHALYLYDHLFEQGLSKHDQVYQKLLKSNEYFQGVIPIRGPPGSLVTYSFEKESSIDEITLLYKDPEYTDDEWLELSTEERLDFLKRVGKFIRKTFLSNSKVAPTQLRPHYLSGYSREMESFRKRGFSWEVSNKRYEIKIKRIVAQIREVAKIFNESHSIHAHIVFDMPLNYEHFKKFSLWTKHVNDYLYLRGMEEGLHGDDLTAVAHLEEDQRRTPMKWRLGGTRILPAKQDQITYRSHKFFSMGIRKTLYGSVKGNVEKIGLELRDTTRNLDVLEEYMEEISECVSTFCWEEMDLETYPEELFAGFLNTDRQKSIDSLSKYVSKSTAKKLYDAENTVGLPLINFEAATFLNYSKSNQFRLSADQKLRVEKAREDFIKELRILEKDLERQKTVDKLDLQMAIRLDLSVWAKRVRASEFFQEIFNY